MTPHERLIALCEGIIERMSRDKDEPAPVITDPAAWLAALKEHYAATPPQPFPVATRRKPAVFDNRPSTLPESTALAGAHERLRRMAGG